MSKLEIECGEGKIEISRGRENLRLKVKSFGERGEPTTSIMNCREHEIRLLAKTLNIMADKNK